MFSCTRRTCSGRLTLLLLVNHTVPSLQLLTYYTEDADDFNKFSNETCWHSRHTSAIIHTQNITFNKYPGQNIRVRDRA